MFRIRKVPDARAPANRTAVAAAQAILKAQFPGMAAAEIDKLPDRLADPFAHRFIAELFVAEDGRGQVRATALLLYDPKLAFAFLDVLATAPKTPPGSGIGGALYERLRIEARELAAEGLFFECLPDEPELSPNPETRKQNAARLAFYERFGAFPILGTDYQAPVSPGETDMPFLVFDGLGQNGLPDAAPLRAIVRAILERKYGELCPPEYIARVVGSIEDGGYRLRPPRYARAKGGRPPPAERRPIPLIVNDRHDIHHIRERGYVESPVRISAILSELDTSSLFARAEPRRFPERWIREVHEPLLIEYLKTACAAAPLKTSVYPYVFPVRNAMRRPKERSVLAGYWCIDTFTPINRNVWPAARRGVDCAMTAADEVLNGAPLAYALVRPPGHHAERRTFGGFCYLCNGAIAANYLARHGTVAILDIDYHHGNGQQDIFYERADVLTVSIHGDPSFAYPYFTGFREETGKGQGAGYNLNLPLPETITPDVYRATLDKALARIGEFGPEFLVLSVGFDTARGDPTGTWSNRAGDFRLIGETIGAAGYPTVVIQEGGYRVRTLGVNARNFFEGLAHAAAASRRRGHRTLRKTAAASPRRVWRTTIRPTDPEQIRSLVDATGRFSAAEIAIAEELAQERIERGAASGYEFILASEGDRLVGYTCYGEVPGSDVSWDLYWIAVAPAAQGRGLGRQLIERTEAAVRRAGGAAIYADTSSSPAYAATRAFYERAGYQPIVELPDFYRPGDGKVIYCKRILADALSAGSECG